MHVVLRRYWPVLAATAVLLPHARLFDFVTDDAYISFRYAANLAEHGQLVFNLGERVEGFTNFLWTVLLAAGIKLGLGPVATSRFFGVGFGVGTLALVVRMSLRLSGQRPSAWHLVAPALLASMGADPTGAGTCAPPGPGCRRQTPRQRNARSPPGPGPA